MLTPAVDAYGWPVVVLVLVVLALSLVALAVDFRRYARAWDRHRAARHAAMRRHPAGRGRRAYGYELYGPIGYEHDPLALYDAPARRGRHRLP